MKMILIIAITFTSYLNFTFNQYLYGKPCFDIHEMIKYSNVYRENLAFNKNLVTSGETFEIYEDFIYMKEFESRILERIKNDKNNLIRNEIGLDTNDIGFKNYLELNELSRTLDSTSAKNIMLFQIFYNEYIILAEVNNFDVSKRNTLHNKIYSMLDYNNGDGFDISKFNSVIIYYLFKCDPEMGLKYIDSYKESNFP